MIANIALDTVADLHETDPAQAEAVWSALDSVKNGLGGGNEVVGGLWVLLISWTALQTNALPRALNYVGLVAGVAGIVTIIPALEVIGAIFGLGLIVWFVWVGIVLLGRDSSRAAHPGPDLRTKSLGV
jgi:prepilin signal peptidase PulO-like enzyme (type II secretory pathway)